MRTRAKVKCVASDRARRENVPRHILCSSKNTRPDWVNVSEDGIVSGTPQTIGKNGELIVSVTDAEGNYKERSISFGYTKEATLIDALHFPDGTFRTYVTEERDLEHDGMLTEPEIIEVNFIGVSSLENSDLKGIELFTELTELRCDDNDLTALDVSNNVKLQKLNCSANALASLDISKNKKLQKLDCSNNELTVFNLDNSNLSELSCSR